MTLMPASAAEGAESQVRGKEEAKDRTPPNEEGLIEAEQALI